MTSSLHTRGYPLASFPNPRNASQPDQYGSVSVNTNRGAAPQGLFPAPAPMQMAPPPPSEAPRPNDSIMNRRGDENSSLYQICLNLRRRMAEVPGFEVHLLEMEEEEAEANDSTDPVTSMWNCLRRGYPLMTIYNALRPKVPLEVDASRLPEAKLGKAATFKFLQACMTELKYPARECFLITDLYGGDTTGFVKVTKVVNRVLDTLAQRGLLLHTESQVLSNTEGTSQRGDSEETPQLLHRRHVVNEIVKSERDYVEHLGILQSFKKELEERGSIAGDVLHDIFMNLNALLDFQRRFLIRIEQQNSLPESQQNWGQLFIQYKDSFRVYEPFIANQVRCQKAVDREWDKIKAAPLSDGIKGIVDIQTNLTSFLLKPFQRLSKYPMLLKDMRNKGGLDEGRREDLLNGAHAASSILQRANEAVAKEQRLAAVSELQSRVEDWKGHQIDHFGELLLFGDYTVVKGEGAKEVEREVRIRIIHNAMTPKCRSLARLATGQPTKSSRFCFRALVGIQFYRRLLTQLLTLRLKRARGPSPAALYRAALRSQGYASPRVHIRFVSGLEGVPEEDSSRADEERCVGLQTAAPRAHAQAPASTPKALRSHRSRPRLINKSKRGVPAIPSARSSPRDGEGSEGSSAPPTPSRRGKESSIGKLAAFSSIVKKKGHKVRKIFLKSPRQPVDPTVWQHLLMNGPFKQQTNFLTPKLSHRKDPEKQFCIEQKLTKAVRLQYKVYLFERILLCCKEINPNKPKNKMLGNNKPLLDKRGKPRLQLKGRIFMQNVTDIVTVIRSAEKADYKIQIYWKGDPGVESFVIRFLSEVDMNTWRDQVQVQKKTLSESARSSGQTGPSETEFLSMTMRDQTNLKNPYADEDVDEDDSQPPTMLPGLSAFHMSRNASSNSLRSAGAPVNGPPRAPPLRFPMPDPSGAAAYHPPLTLQTNLPPGQSSSGEFAGSSCFSPGGDSPMSTRSSSQASMYTFPRQNTPRLSNEDGKHKTAPAMPRAPSRDGIRPINGYTIDGRTVMRPSLPVMAGPQNAQQQLAMTHRLRSASTPDIQPMNSAGPKRYASGQLQPNVENVPVPPIPPHMAQMRAPIARSQTSSPTNGSLPTRNNTQSPMYQRDRAHRQTADHTGYEQQMQQRLQAIPHSEPRRYQEGSYADASLRVMKNSTVPAPVALGDSGLIYPTQLKVKIRFDPAPSHVTIVVPIIIKHRSLVDRIDSKMTKISSASISKGTARLRYKDEDGDFITIKTDDDVQIAIDDWAKSNEDSIRRTVYPDFELFWQPLA